MVMEILLLTALVACITKDYWFVPVSELFDKIKNR